MDNENSSADAFKYDPRNVKITPNSAKPGTWLDLQGVEPGARMRFGNSPNTMGNFLDVDTHRPGIPAPYLPENIGQWCEVRAWMQEEWVLLPCTFQPLEQREYIPIDFQLQLDCCSAHAIPRTLSMQAQFYVGKFGEQLTEEWGRREIVYLQKLVTAIRARDLGGAFACARGITTEDLVVLDTIVDCAGDTLTHELCRLLTGKDLDGLLLTTWGAEQLVPLCRESSAVNKEGRRPCDYLKKD